MGEHSAPSLGEPWLPRRAAANVRPAFPALHPLTVFVLCLHPVSWVWSRGSVDIALQREVIPVGALGQAEERLPWPFQTIVLRSCSRAY